MFDIRDCKGAEQVVVVADQNYSGELLRILTKLNDNHAYTNVKLYTSGEQHEYSWNSQLTRHWANFHHTNNCVQKVYEVNQTF